MQSRERLSDFLDWFRDPYNLLVLLTVLVVIGLPAMGGYFAVHWIQRDRAIAQRDREDALRLAAGDQAMHDSLVCLNAVSADRGAIRTTPSCVILLKLDTHRLMPAARIFVERRIVDIRNIANHTRLPYQNQEAEHRIRLEYWTRAKSGL